MGSLVILSVDVGRLATFYQAVLTAAAVAEPSGDVRLSGERDEVLIHTVPAMVARNIVVSSPPAAREGSPIKPVFDVSSLDSVLDVVRANGGVVTDFHFVLDGLARHDVLDPDGNVIQLRGRVA